MWWCVGPGCATRFESQRSEALRLQNGVKTRWVRLCFLPLSLLPAPASELATTPYHTALGYAATKPSINSADVSWQVIFTNHETYGKRGTTDSSRPHPSYTNSGFSASTAAHSPVRKREGLPSATKTAFFFHRLEFSAETSLESFPRRTATLQLYHRYRSRRMVVKNSIIERWTKWAMKNSTREKIFHIRLEYLHEERLVVRLPVNRKFSSKLYREQGENLRCVIRKRVNYTREILHNRIAMEISWELMNRRYLSRCRNERWNWKT